MEDAHLATALELKAKADAANDRKDFSVALTLITQSIELDDTDPEAYFILASLLDAIDKPDEAIIALDRAIQLDQADEFNYFMRGSLEAQASRFAEAIVDFDAAIAIDPEDEEFQEARAEAIAALSGGAPANYGSTSSEEVALHEFDAGYVIVPPGKTIYLCRCTLTSRRLLIRDRNDNTHQVMLDEIMGVRIQGLVMKQVVLQLRDWACSLDCKKQSPQVAAWIREAIASG